MSRPFGGENFRFGCPADEGLEISVMKLHIQTFR